MKITVVGAGAIGGTVGALLKQGGCDVTLVDTVEEHVRTINEKGLTIVDHDKETVVPIRACTPEELAAQQEGPLECVFLSVKMQNTDQAVDEILPILGDKSFVISLQNGFNGKDIAQKIGKERTMISFVNIFADYIRPGVINYGGKGALVIGELEPVYSDRMKMLKRELKGIDQLQFSDNVTGFLWSKTGYAAILMATTLTNDTIADVIDNPKYRVMLMDTASEVFELASLEGIRLEKFDDFDPADAWPREGRDLERMNRDLDVHVERLRGYTKIHTGVWRDIVVRKRKIEGSTHGNLVDLLAEKHGMEMPLYHLGQKLLHEVADGTRPFSTDNLDIMLEADRRIYGR